MKKKLIVLALAAGGIFAAGSQRERAIFDFQDDRGSVVNDIKAQAADELKKAFAHEIETFFESSDLKVTLGLSSDEQDKLETSIKKYIDDYSMDEEKLSEAKESVEQLLENAQGLSADELQNKIAGIFQENE